MRARESGQSSLLLLDVIEQLNKLNIPYLVVGALAVAYYGIVRASQDADAVIFVPDMNDSIKNMKTVLTGMGLNAVFKRGSADDPLNGVVLIEDPYANRVDLILGVKGLGAECLERTRTGKINDETIAIIGPEDLVAMKVFAGGTKDLEDVRGIINVSGDELDLSLLKTLTRRYGAHELRTLEQLLSENC
jgi:hypothetical protein